MGEVVPARTLPTLYPPSPPSVLLKVSCAVTSTLRGYVSSLVAGATGDLCLLERHCRAKWLTQAANKEIALLLTIPLALLLAVWCWCDLGIPLPFIQALLSDTVDETIHTARLNTATSSLITNVLADIESEDDGKRAHYGWKCLMLSSFVAFIFQCVVNYSRVCV